MDETKLWKYCMIYVGFAAAVLLMDLLVLPETSIFQLNRAANTFAWTASAPELFYLAATLLADRWMEHAIQSEMKNQPGIKDGIPPVFQAITGTRTALLSIWLLALVIYVETFWVGIFHMALLVDAISVWLRVLILCRGSAGEKEVQVP